MADLTPRSPYTGKTAEELYDIRGRLMRSRRDEQHLSQPQLARKARVTAAMISRLESGERRGRPRLVAEVAQILGLTKEFVQLGFLPEEEARFVVREVTEVGECTHLSFARQLAESWDQAELEDTLGRIRPDELVVEVVLNRFCDSLYRQMWRSCPVCLTVIQQVVSLRSGTTFTRNQGRK